MNHYLTLCLATLFLFFNSACNEFQTPETAPDALQQVNKGDSVTGGLAPKCEVDYDEYNLDVKVLAFEIEDRFGMGFGFNLLEGIVRALGLSFETEKGQMIMSMSMGETIRPEESVAYVMGRGNARSNDFRFAIDVWRLSADLNYFNQTPLSDLTSNGVIDTLKKLSQEMEAAAVRWKSKVVYANYQEVVIPVGAVSGVQPGDLFNIYNVDYIWDGAPCDSQLLLEKKTTVEPLVEAEAVQVENNASLLRITTRNFDESIRLGARVEVNRLIPGDGRRLSRPVRVRSVESEPIVFEEYADLDITVFIHEQVRALMDIYGFHPRN